MYTLRMIFPEDPVPREAARVAKAADVLTAIPELLRAHPGCERLDVMYHTVRLFSVDCEGNQIQG